MTYYWASSRIGKEEEWIYAGYKTRVDVGSE